MTSPNYNTINPGQNTLLGTWDPTVAFKAGGGANSNGNTSITSQPIWGPYFGNDYLIGIGAGDPNAIPTSQQSGGSTGGWQTGLGQFVGATIGALLGTSGARQQPGGAQVSCPQDYREGYHRDPSTCEWIPNQQEKKNDWWIWALLALLVLLVVMTAGRNK